MTQRVFDIENKKDMQDLWDILPDYVKKMSCDKILPIGLIQINWHDKTEITRPIQEATFNDIGKLCRFWNDEEKKQLWYS